jgi:hypothetical protein
MDKPIIREVDLHTFWKWLTRDVEVGNRKGVGDARIPLTNARGAWMNWHAGESEIIIHVYNGQKDDDGMYCQCGEISFRFSAYKNKLYEIYTRIGGEPFITDYYKGDLVKKIEDKWPALPRVKLGRRHYPEDVWAHDEVCKKGRHKRDVETEWLKRIEEKRIFAHKASSHRHFQKIISPEWGK